MACLKLCSCKFVTFTGELTSLFMGQMGHMFCVSCKRRRYQSELDLARKKAAPQK